MREEPRQGVHARMLAVRNGEGVVDIDIPERGKRLCKGRAPLFLPGVAPQVLQEHHTAVSEFAQSFVHLPQRRGDKARVNNAVELASHWQERAPRTPEMREDNGLGAGLAQERNCRERAVKAKAINHPSLFNRNIKVKAQEHMLPAQAFLFKLSEFSHVFCFSVPAPARALRHQR